MPLDGLPDEPKLEKSTTDGLRLLIEQCKNGTASFDDLHTALAVFEVRNGYPLTLNGEIVGGYDPPTAFHWVTNEQMGGIWISGYVAAQDGEPESANPYPG